MIINWSSSMAVFGPLIPESRQKSLGILTVMGNLPSSPYMVYAEVTAYLNPDPVIEPYFRLEIGVKRHNAIINKMVTSHTQQYRFLLHLPNSLEEIKPEIERALIADCSDYPPNPPFNSIDIPDNLPEYIWGMIQEWVDKVLQ